MVITRPLCVFQPYLSLTIVKSFEGNHGSSTDFACTMRPEAFFVMGKVFKRETRPRRLVLKCFPKRTRLSPWEARPNPNELSSLLFHVSAQKSDLEAVGSALVRKAQHDAAKMRIG